jgi:hypothetical protein
MPQTLSLYFQNPSAQMAALDELARHPWFDPQELLSSIVSFGPL